MEKMLEGRISDLARSSEYEVKRSGFLTPAEQRAALDAARANGDGGRCFFWGGVAGCERRAALFLPEWMTGDFCDRGGAFDESREEFVKELTDSGADGGEIAKLFAPLEISGSPYTELSHRDYLGALLSLGLERDAIGDIFPTGPSGAVVFATPEAAELILSDLVSVGREKVSVTRAELPASFRITREFEAITDTVMSIRLDGVVKALCNISREAASDLVLSGDVSVNYVVAAKPDMSLEKGDVISVRGYGKYIFDGDRGVNRRGRIRIDARKYV